MVDARRRLLPVLLTAALGAGCGPPGPPPEPARNVLLILVDTLRSDRLGTYGYERPTSPRIDELAASGAVFLRHYSQGSHTRAAMPSLVYSRYFVKSLFPASARVALMAPRDLFQQLDPGAVSLPGLMAASGRRTVLINTHPWLQPRTEFAKLFEEVKHVHGDRDPAVNRGRPMAGADRLVDAALAWIDAAPPEPFFMHLHLMDPHEPLLYTEDAEALLPADAPRPPERWNFDDQSLRGRDPSEEEKRLLRLAYDGAVRSTDRQLGRLFDALAERRLLDETLVVLTSDHGEALYEYGPRRGHGGAMREAVARVPLILRYPAAVAPSRFEELSQSVDVLPTVARLAGARLPEGARVDGIDLLDASLRRQREIVAGSSFVRGERHKILFSVSPEAALGRPVDGEPFGELYDLESDPKEARDLWSSRPQVVGELIDAYRRMLAAPYELFFASRADVQPAFTFALSVGVLRPTSGGGGTEAFAEQGWKVVSTPQNDLLRAGVESRPIEGELRLPSGRYRLAAFGFGAFDVEADTEGSCLAAEAGSLRFEQKVGTPRLRPLGEVQVCETRLRLRIVPRDAGMLAHFSFSPLGQPEEDLAGEERDRTLEALGYVN